MSPTRLVLRGVPIGPGEITVPAAASHHARAARVERGEAIELLDLDGVVGTGRLIAWEGRSCRVLIEGIARERGETPAPLVLALGVLHTDAFAWAVEKATELGATRVVPVLASRVQRRDHARRAERWQRVADAAVAQCGRSRAPLVSEPVPLEEVFAIPASLRLVGDPGAPAPPGGSGVGGVLVVVGPEGGFAADERAALAHAGFRGLGLGPRTLRAETAALAALALAQHLVGWL